MPFARRIAALICCLPIIASAKTNWQHFQWENAVTIPGTAPEPAALLLPAKLNGSSCFVQLDTGMNGHFLWHAPAAGGTVPISVEVGSLRSTAQADQATADRINSGDCKGIASVGNAFFDHGTLTLDLKQQRYAFEPAALLVDVADAQPLIYARWYEVGGHTLVEVRLPNGRLGYALLDTGATRFGLSPLSAADWDEVTGGLALTASDAVTEYKTNSWGKQISCFETRANGPLTIANTLKLNTFRASYCAFEGFKPGQKLLGLLGLKELMGHVVTLDYLSQRWLLR
jgi:hypothetical protein